ncbi:hypothetical protein HanRHA438_Chr17g0791141 [Helianthus annuus]|nr:hypothetical protein HanRHA438_Chr17g0791141 [Helianthus annuus]
MIVHRFQFDSRAYLGFHPTVCYVREFCLCDGTTTMVVKIPTRRRLIPINRYSQSHRPTSDYFNTDNDCQVAANGMVFRGNA